MEPEQMIVALCLFLAVTLRLENWQAQIGPANAWPSRKRRSRSPARNRKAQSRSGA